MRAVIQRVVRASVSVEGAEVASIRSGLVILLGISTSDQPPVAEALARKVVGLRLFEGPDGRMDASVVDIGGSILCVSQFTLYGDVRRGRRASWDQAAPAAVAEPLYERFCAAVEAEGVSCQRGVFGAHMLVELGNDGPVTLILDSDDLARPRRA